MVEALVERLQPHAYKEGETILRQDEEEKGQEDDVQVIVLEGSVNKIRLIKNGKGDKTEK